MAKITLQLHKRDVFRKKVKRLRQQGEIPGNIFGRNVKSLAVTAKLADFEIVSQKAGETQIVYLQVDGEDNERPALLTNIQYQPVDDQILHVDYRQVDLKEKVTANIPVELIGESPAVKDFQAVVVPSITEIEVEALPTDLLEKIEVDISQLKQIGDAIKVADLKIDTAKIEVLTDPETIVVTATPQQAEEIVPPPVTETPAEPGAAPTEATAPAEGEKKPDETKSKPE